MTRRPGDAPVEARPGHRLAAMSLSSFHPVLGQPLPQPPMNRLTAEQCRRNRSRDDQWELSSAHRRNVTDRISALAGDRGGRLCVLGAGNSNDLDLAGLVSAYDEVHLVDIDGEALRRGAQRQLVSTDTVKLYGGVDVTGVWESLGELLAKESPPSDAERENLVRRAATPDPLPLPAPFDVVVSVGLISQLIEAVVMAVPATCPKFMELLLSVRTGHLRLLAELTAPGGHGLLITDFVSSATVPELLGIADDQMARLAERLAAEGNFFHGLNPLFLPGIFEQDPTLQRLIAKTTHRGYWRWDQRNRAYAVLAIEFERTLSSFILLASAD